MTKLYSFLRDENFLFFLKMIIIKIIIIFKYFIQCITHIHFKYYLHIQDFIVNLLCSLCEEQGCVQMQLFLSLQWYSLQPLPVQCVISFLFTNLTGVSAVMASVMTNKATSLLIFISILQGKRNLIHSQAFSTFISCLYPLKICGLFN